MILSARCWYPAFVIYRWRHVLWALPLVALLVLLGLHWSRLRFDHVTASYGVDLSSSLFSGSRPSRISQLFDLTRSPEVLGKAAHDCGLADTRGMTDFQAAEYLRSRVICDIAPDSGLFELKVRKLSDGDALELSKAIETKLCEKLTVAFDASLAHSRAEKEAVLQKAIAELEAKIEASRVEFLAGKPTIENPGDEAQRFEDLTRIQEGRRLVEQLKRDMMYDGCVDYVGPFREIQSTHWLRHPEARDLKVFGIASAWTFGVSVLIALVLAYLLEALVPRKLVKEEIVPEIQSSNECS